MIDPINSSKQGCVPTSSNCVKWQGPYIEGLSLCSDASVTEVILQMANELNNIKNGLDISSYELKCLEESKCGPKEFNDLVQLIINKLCSISSSNGVDVSALVMNIEPKCFKELNDGDTEINIPTYANLIAERVCYLLTELSDIKDNVIPEIVNVIESHETDIQSIKESKQDLIDIHDCDDNTNVNEVLQGTIDTLCEYKEVLGTTEELAADHKCDLSYYEKYLSTESGNMMKDISVNRTVADNIKNIWLVLCDLRKEVYMLKEQGNSDVYQSFNAYMRCDGVIYYKYNYAYNDEYVDKIVSTIIAPLSIVGTSTNINKAQSDGYYTISTYANNFKGDNNPEGGAFEIILKYKLKNDDKVYAKKEKVVISKSITGLTGELISYSEFKIKFNKASSSSISYLYRENEETGEKELLETYDIGTQGPQEYFLNVKSGKYKYYVECNGEHCKEVVTDQN